MLRPGYLRALVGAAVLFAPACAADGAPGEPFARAAAAASRAEPAASAVVVPPANTTVKEEAAPPESASSPVFANFVGGDRPVAVHVPASYQDGHPVPLVLLLHGYGGTGANEEAYMQLAAEADLRGFLYAYPNGTIDVAGNRFWNATDACCDFFHTDVDDSAYLAGVIEEIESRYSVAPRQVYVIGHSNGAFMAYRMACDHADLISGIVSLAGATWDDPGRCKPSMPVSVLEIHGTLDTLVPFEGGVLDGAPFPPVRTTVADWVTVDRCVTDEPGASLDLDSAIPGDDTTTRHYGSCLAASSVDLWVIHGGDHIPPLTDAFTPAVIGHLLGPL
jgi:polyhydroxybutyrate depolymerase